MKSYENFLFEEEVLRYEEQEIYLLYRIDREFLSILPIAAYSNEARAETMADMRGARVKKFTISGITKGAKIYVAALFPKEEIEAKTEEELEIGKFKGSLKEPTIECFLSFDKAKDFFIDEVVKLNKTHRESVEMEIYSLKIDSKTNEKTKIIPI